jgi:serine/threonine-protein kinase
MRVNTIFKVILSLILLLPVVLGPVPVHSGSSMQTDVGSEEDALFFPMIYGKPEQIFVHPTSFHMGCDASQNGGYECDLDELPLHAVDLDAYMIDRTKVTNAEYQVCVADGACTPPSDFTSSSRPWYYPNPVFADYPVIYVNWYQSQAYCEWAGGRLPTEAEWENAARGTFDNRPYPWGDAAPTCELVNAKIDGIPCVWDTSIVTGYSPQGDSPYGLQGMAGNVYEWMNDWYLSTYYQISPRDNPTGPPDGTLKVRRAGGFGSLPNFLRVAVRIPTQPDVSRNFIGFRCAYTP